MGEYVKPLSKSCLWGVDLLIFVTLGTQDKPFPRLIKLVEEQIEKGNIKEEVVVQAGHTHFESTKMKILGMIPMEEYQKYMNDCDLLITHGGVGSIFDAMKLGKKIIATPRLKKYNEHVNDHQKELLSSFSKEGYLLVYNEGDSFEEILKKSKTFKFKKYKSNNNKMIELITNFIEEN